MSDDMSQDEMLTAEEVAQYMKVNIRKVREWVGNGEITIVMVGKREYRILRSELNRFIRDRQARRGQAE